MIHANLCKLKSMKVHLGNFSLNSRVTTIKSCRIILLHNIHEKGVKGRFIVATSTFHHKNGIVSRDSDFIGFHLPSPNHKGMFLQEMDSVCKAYVQTYRYHNDWRYTWMETYILVRKKTWKDPISKQFEELRKLIFLILKNCIRFYSWQKCMIITQL